MPLNQFSARAGDAGASWGSITSAHHRHQVRWRMPRGCTGADVSFAVSGPLCACSASWLTPWGLRCRVVRAVSLVLRSCAMSSAHGHAASQRHAPQAHRHDPQQPPQQQPPPPPLLQEGVAGNVPLHPENAKNDGDAASALPPPAQLPPDKGLAAKTQFILSRAKQALGKTSGGGR